MSQALREITSTKVERRRNIDDTFHFQGDTTHGAQIAATEKDNPEKLRAVESATRLVTTGSGPDIRWARQPGYFNSAKGRVAFVAASPSFGRAPVSVDDPTRGGTFALRTTRCTIVPAEREAEFRGRDEECVRVGNVDAPTWSYEMDQGDLDAILASVREGKMRSHFLAVGTHAHQTVYKETPGGGICPRLRPAPWPGARASPRGTGRTMPTRRAPGCSTLLRRTGAAPCGS